VYCVGDIHGRDDLLREMAERVGADMKNQSFDIAVTVFLGDYIDRGPGTMRVVERLATGEWPTPIIALAGNHEDFLLTFLDDAGFLAFWRGQGGLETLHSYGVNIGPAMAGREFEEVQAAFTARFPKQHWDFLKALKGSAVIGDYFFCHAGVRPGVPLDRQDRDDLLNIREPFLSSEAEQGKLVIHVIRLRSLQRFVPGTPTCFAFDRAPAGRASRADGAKQACLVCGTPSTLLSRGRIAAINVQPYARHKTDTHEGRPCCVLSPPARSMAASAKPRIRSAQQRTQSP
jgi:serine/threonine protein phosphatase 1